LELSAVYSLPLPEAAKRIVAALREEGLSPRIIILAEDVEVELSPAGHRRIGPVKLEQTHVLAKGGRHVLTKVRRAVMLGGG